MVVGVDVVVVGVDVGSLSSVIPQPNGESARRGVSVWRKNCQVSPTLK